MWARGELIEQVKRRAKRFGVDEAGYGDDEAGYGDEDASAATGRVLFEGETCRLEAGSGDEDASVVAESVIFEGEKCRRLELMAEIRRSGFEQVIEEAAYTWFSRIIALRYMEINGFLPSQIRVFSDAEGVFNPEGIKDVLNLELYSTDEAKNGLRQRLLIILCNELNRVMPYAFGRMSGYIEMLLPDNIFTNGGFIERLVSCIPEGDWRGAVQIIGWMYQYYNAETKQEVFDGLKDNIKIARERIPAATQLFTPDWIVRYLVENSLGRLVLNRGGWLPDDLRDAHSRNMTVDMKGAHSRNMTVDMKGAHSRNKTGDMKGAHSRNMTVDMKSAHSRNEIERKEREREIAKTFGWMYYLPEAEQTLDTRGELSAFYLAAESDYNRLPPADDSGSPATDSGLPAHADSGSPAADSGSPANDSGSPANDSGSPAADSGLPADAGRRHAKFDVEKIKFLDPCMGCGHILIYAFDVFMQIYRWMGYADRDAAKLILEKNLYGLEIDQRACQLAAFSLMMKAKQYNCDIAPFVPLNSLLAPQCKEQHIALPASSLTSPSEEQRSALPTSLLMSLCKTQQITPLAPTPASPLAPQCKEQHIVPQVFHPCGFEDGMEFGSLLRAEDLDGLPHANGGRHNAFCDESDAPSANARRRDTFSDGADNIHVPSDADNIHYSSCADCIPYPSDADNIHDLSCADCIPDPSSADNMHNPSCADNIHDLSGADSIPDPSGAYNFFHLLAQKYDLVVTNPPYLGKSGMNDRLARFVKEKYPDSKSDLFAAFIERCGEFLKPHGLQAMITMESWMFLSCYESLRQKLFRTRAIINLIHMPYLGRGGTSLGINFGTSMFVMSKQTIKGYLGQYGCIRFYETDDDGVPFTFPTENERYKTTSARNFEKIPGAPVAYWVSEKVFDIFAAGKSINEMSDFTGSQNITSDNERYLRFIWEVGAAEIGRGRRWTFYAKGGDYRKWYGNIEYLVDISDAAKNYYKSNQTANLLSKEYWYREGITYSAVTSKGTGFRYLPPIGGFDKGGATLCDVQNIYYILALLNSKVAEMAFKILNPTINMQIRDIKALPIFVDDEKLTTIERLAKENIQLSNADWDAFETSKDFKRHPLLGHLNA